MKTKSKRPHLRDTETGWDRFWKSFWKGPRPSENRKFIITGRFDKSTRMKISRIITKILEKSDSIKIGKTGDPYIRGDKRDYRGTYDNMYILYRSRSQEYVSLMEEHFVKKFKKSHPNKVDNRISHRAGNMTSYNGFYYMYVVSN